MKLDRIDRRILEGHTTQWPREQLELAEQVGLSPTPCSRRVKRLEESGIIRRHVTLLNQSHAGTEAAALYRHRMDRHPDRFGAFRGGSGPLSRR